MAYLLGFIGAILQIVFILWQEKEKHDEGLATNTWREYFLKKWDNFVVAVIFAMALVFLQDYLLPIIVYVAGVEQTEIYRVYEIPEAHFGISFIIGFFSTRIAKKLKKKGEERI